MFSVIAIVASACSVEPSSIAFSASENSLAPTIESSPEVEPDAGDVAGAAGSAPVEAADGPNAGSTADETTEPGAAADRSDEIAIPVLGSLEWGQCDFVDISEAYEGQVDCGWLTRNAARAGSDDFVLPVMRFRARNATSDAEPIIYLHGGPGGGRVSSAEFLVDTVLWPYNETRDVIVFDQRASGLAEPEISCLTVLLANERIAFRTMRNCLDRMRLEGVDIADLTLAASAADVAALIRELDAAPAVLYGASWGGRLAIEAANRYPQAVHAVVLDSPLVPNHDLVGAMPASFQEAITNLERQCESDPACSAADDLNDRFVALAEALEAEPVSIDLTPINASFADTETIEIGGDELASLFFSMLYSESETAAIPDIVTDLEAGDTRLLSRFAALSGIHTVSDPTFLAYMCNDVVPLSSPSLVAGARTGIATYDSIDAIPDGRGPTAFDLCDRVNLGNEPPDHIVIDDPPPMVVLAGLYDPITPHSASVAYAEANDHVQLVTVAQGGHVVGNNACAQAVVADFLFWPAGSVQDCAIEWTPFFDDAALTVRPPAPVEVARETSTEIAGQRVELLVPTGWFFDVFEIPGEAGDIWWRDHSLEDQTALVLFREGTGDGWLDFYNAYPAGRADDMAGWTQQRFLSGTGVAFARFERDGVVALIQGYPEEIDDLVSQLSASLTSIAPET